MGFVSLLQKNHIFTSGASGTNAAVIRGALRAERPELLTVILPQSLKKQPPESQELLSKVRIKLSCSHSRHCKNTISKCNCPFHIHINEDVLALDVIGYHLGTIQAKGSRL